MNDDYVLTLSVAASWALLALVYALAPWSGMRGYAWLWGFGALLFAGLAALLRRRAGPGADRRSGG